MTTSLPSDSKERRDQGWRHNQQNRVHARADMQIITFTVAKNRLRRRLHKKQPQHPRAKFLPEHGDSIPTLQRRRYERDKSRDVLLWYIISLLPSPSISSSHHSCLTVWNSDISKFKVHPPAAPPAAQPGSQSTSSPAQPQKASPKPWPSRPVSFSKVASKAG